MYNQEIKEKFIKETTANWVKSNSCSAVFESIGIVEYDKQIDLAQMQISDAVLAISHCNISTYSTAFSAISTIRSYVKWCAKANCMSNINIDILNISIDDIDISDGLSKCLFKDESDLISSMRSVRTFNEGYYEVVAISLAWLGLDRAQILELKISDVDFENKTILTKDDSVIPMSNAIYDVLHTYSRTKTAMRGIGNSFMDVYRDDSFGKFVRKFTPASKLGKKPLEKAQLHYSIYELNEAHKDNGGDTEFTISNVAMSGGLRRVYELEASGVDVFQSRNKELVVGAYRVKAKLHEILWLYRNYKRAFSL